MSFQSGFNNVASMIRTENGALGCDYTKVIEHPLVQCLYGIASQEGNNIDTNKCLQIFNSYCNDLLNNRNDEQAINYLIRFAFLTRDISGQGRRDLGRRLILKIIDFEKLSADQIVNLLANEKYGRWDDALWLIDNINTDTVYKQEFHDRLIHLVIQQLISDISALTAKKCEAHISLLAKWMPSINTSSAETRKNAINWVGRLNMTNKSYRQMLSKLRKQIDIVERKICSNQWNQIEFEKVPSQAINRYRNTFYNHDYEGRFIKYIEDVNNNKAKINTSTLSVPEIVHDYCQDWNCDSAIEALWNNVKCVKFDRPIIPVCDVSGSMLSPVCGMKLTALDVSVGLSIFFAQNNIGGYHNKIIAFTHQAECIDLDECSSLWEKVRLTLSHCGYNTNVENVLQTVLDIAIKSADNSTDIPTLVFFSDMEFDEQCRDASVANTIFENYRNKFKAAGFEFPKIVFWNINNRSGAIQMTENPNGLIECSGFSQNMFDMIISDDYDSWHALKRILDNDRYSKII